MSPRKGDVTSFALAQLGLRAKPLPRRVFPRIPPALDAPRLQALRLVLAALDELKTHAERMNVLAACAALHDDVDEAVFFLAQAVEDDRGRCGRCGRAAKLSKWRNEP